MPNNINLTEKKCVPCEGGVPKLTLDEAKKYLKLTPDWNIEPEQNYIYRLFEFKGFYKTMAFVNAVAWIANQEGHHPDMEVSYNKCLVKFTTHAVMGLTDNDFICAAKVNKLIE